MNSTDTTMMTGEGYGYATIILGVLFVLSEVMPFIKKHKGNGVMDTLVCMLRGSSCMATKLADAIEKCEEKQEEVNDKKENV
jgi:methyl coenzyme M reductase subunit C